jgi:hypothetical protein
MRCPIVLPVAVVLLGSLLSSSAAKQPQFKDYPVDGTFSGVPSPPIFRTPGQRMFRNVIKDGLKKGPNFAGRFTVAEWGCGTGCVSIAVVDNYSGAVYDGPVGSLPHAAIYLGPPPDPSLTGVFYRQDSRLLVIKGCPNWRDCGAYYYEWRENSFILLKRDAILPSGR